MAVARRAPEKVFGLMDMRQNLKTFLPILDDMLDGVPSAMIAADQLLTNA